MAEITLKEPHRFSPRRMAGEMRDLFLKDPASRKA
jgi:hypothetical protein